MIISMNFARKRSWVFPVIITVIIVVGVIISSYTAVTVHNINKRDLIDRVNTIAQAIDVKDVESLSATDSDINNPTYTNLKSLLTRVRSVNSDVRFIYLNGIKDGELFFYVDSEDPSSESYSPPGEPYPEATSLMYQLFQNRMNGFEIASDRWGLWASVYVPIISPETGNVVALLGMDVMGLFYILNFIAYSVLPMLLTLMIVAMLTILKRRFDREQYYIDQKAEFLSIASHEIRTPLTGIRWATETIINNNSDVMDADRRRTLMLIHENCVGLINRINNLLSVTVLEGRKTQDVVKEPVYVKSLIDEINQSLKLSAFARNVTLKTDSFPNNVVISCDQEKIRQVLTNLISNAIKYTKLNTTVEVSYKSEDGYHLISVADHGNGIESGQQKKIFSGFYRTEDAKKSEQYGSGLGLYLADKITKMHGGEINVVSKTGEGSIFTLKIKG